MEFLPGAFEREWERRRVALLHELQAGPDVRMELAQKGRGSRHSRSTRQKAAACHWMGGLAVRERKRTRTVHAQALRGTRAR